MVCPQKITVSAELTQENDATSIYQHHNHKTELHAGHMQLNVFSDYCAGCTEVSVYEKLQ